MITSISRASSPLALMVESRIQPFDLPIEFTSEWDELAMQPVMLMRLPDTCETVAYFLYTRLNDPNFKEDLAELKRVVITCGSVWDVQFDKWQLAIQIPDNQTPSANQSELYALLQSKI